MRVIVVFVALIGMCATNALADENNLAGGVLITHYVTYPAIRYVTPLCERYDTDPDFGIDDASEQVCRIDEVLPPPGYLNPAVWYVVAAFHEDKIWCGTQFGLGDYHPYVFYICGQGECLDNCLMIPTVGWPGPNTGISIAATDEVWEGNYRPIYYFQGYTYLAMGGDFTPTLLELTDYPGQDFMGFGNCMSPVQTWSAEGGALGVFMDGIAVYPQTPGACCQLDGGCEVMVEAECDGEYFPDITCDPNPCPSLVGACCFEDGSCLVVLESDCQASGGDWQGINTNCDPNLCPPPLRACCDDNGNCTLTTQDDCDGDWFEDEAVCDPNPCPFSASEETSWGEIKTKYRR
jgi:hypothetical protein